MNVIFPHLSSRADEGPRACGQFWVHDESDEDSCPRQSFVFKAWLRSVKISTNRTPRPVANFGKLGRSQFQDSCKLQAFERSNRTIHSTLTNMRLLVDEREFARSQRILVVNPNSIEVGERFTAEDAADMYAGVFFYHAEGAATAGLWICIGLLHGTFLCIRRDQRGV